VKLKRMWGLFPYFLKITKYKNDIAVAAANIARTIFQIFLFFPKILSGNKINNTRKVLNNTNLSICIIEKLSSVEFHLDTVLYKQRYPLVRQHYYKQLKWQQPLN